MCIFCERAKAYLDDPFAGLHVDDEVFGSSSSSRRHDINTTGARNITGRGPTLQQRREAERCEDLKRRTRLPVTVITGFLGAGKTTFVNYLLSGRHGRRLAVIENEFGEVAVDDALLGDGGVERSRKAQQVILMPNGCMCCRVRGDLVEALKRLILISASGAPGGADSWPTSTEVKVAGNDTSEQSEVKSGTPDPASSDQQPTLVKLDGIILECSGLDELAPILQTFFADPFVQEHVHLDAVVCLCDSPRLLRTLVAPPTLPPVSISEPGTEGCSTRTENLEAIGLSLGGIEVKADSSSSAELVMSQLALSDRVLLNKSDLITSEEGNALAAAIKERFPGALVTRCERGKVDIDHVLGVDSFSLDKALEIDKNFAEMLADRPAKAGKTSHHHGREHLHVAGEEGAPGRQHGHDRMKARSVGVELDDGPIDWAKFKSWLKGFLEKEGEMIWRLKGVLWTAVPGKSGGAAGTWGWGAGKRTVVQGLYGHFESEVSEWPTGAIRRSRLVFIGDLTPRTQEALRAGVRACVAPPRSRQPPPPPQRSARGGTSAGSGGAFAARLGSGLYSHFESEVSEWPTGAIRRSRLVFIGDLTPRTQEALRAGVRACVAPPRSRQPPPPPQRSARGGTSAGSGGAFAARLGSVKFGSIDDNVFL